MKALYELWLTGRGLVNEVRSQQLGRGYPVASWYALLAGMGCFPEPARLRKAGAHEAYDLEEVDDLLARSAENFPDQRAALASIAPARRGKSLQVYYW